LHKGEMPAALANMKPSGSVRMNQYTGLCPQAFEYLSPERLQRELLRYGR
jgi:hypothetical protein